MPVGTPYGITRTQKLFCKKETTFGTPVIPATGDCFEILSFSANYVRGRGDRMDHRASRSRIERWTQKRNVEWSCRAYATVSGATGVEPDYAGNDTNEYLLQGMLSNWTGTDEGLFEFEAGTTALPFFTLHTVTENLYGETVVSAWVEEMKISGSAGDPPVIEWSGGAENYAMSGNTAVDGADSGTGTTLVITAADQLAFGEDSLITVDRAGVPFNDIVTARTTNSLTLTTGGSRSAAETVEPYDVATTTTGTVPSGTDGIFTFNPDSGPASTTGILPIDWEVTMKNNHTSIDDEAFQEKTSGTVPGFREVSGRIRFRMRKDWVTYLGVRNNLVRAGLTIQCGTTNESIMKIIMPDCEFEFEGVEWQDDHTAVINMPFVCLAASGASAENELSIQYT